MGYVVLSLRLFSIPVSQPDPDANQDPPTPADRKVPIHGWRLVIELCGLWFCPFVRVLVPVGQLNRNAIANANNPDPPTPADHREVPPHGWRLGHSVPCRLGLYACRMRAARCVCVCGFPQQTAVLLCSYLCRQVLKLFPAVGAD